MSGVQSWQAIVEEVSRRIGARIWPPGDLIPNEADLAAEFGCSRSTVNRALRALAEQGVLERRRKAGTRVCEMPESRARLHIPVIREQITQTGARYRFRLLPVGQMPRVTAPDLGGAVLRVPCLHLADDRPFLLEDRWINTTAVPGAATADFRQANANEWLLRHVPFTTGEIALSAQAASAAEARHLECAQGAALLVHDRVTRQGGATLTAVRLAHAPGYRMQLLL